MHDNVQMPASKIHKLLRQYEMTLSWTICRISRVARVR